MFRSLLFATITSLCIPNLHADILYFDWTPTGMSTGTGTAGELSATYSLLPSPTSRVYTSDNPAYIDSYGSTMPGFEIDNNSSLSGTFSFSDPLPPGSIMVILDIDRGETIAFASNTPLSFVENTERLVGGNSDFPTWNVGGQSISATSGSSSDSAATIVDVSGVTNLSFNFSSPSSSGTAISFGLLAAPESSCAHLVDSFDSENGGSGVLNYDSFVNFRVTRGSVDLIGETLFDQYPGNGHYIDLNGSTGVSGVLETISEFEPGAYKLSFRIGNNANGQPMSPNSVDVSLGDFAETFTRGVTPLTLIERDVAITTKSRLVFSTPASDQDFLGIIIDSVSVVRVTAPILGDVNGDCIVDFPDIPAFIEVLQSGEFQAEADCDENGEVNFQDIPAFIAILINQ